MKTAEEWQKRYWELRDNVRDIHHEKNKHQWDVLVQEIQLDAFKAGMTRAADEVIKVRNERNTEDCNPLSVCVDIQRKILTTRDNLNERTME